MRLVTHGLGSAVLAPAVRNDAVVRRIASGISLVGRASDSAVVDRLLRPPRGTRRTAVQIGDVRAEWVVSQGVPDPHEADRVVLYFHGGAFLIGGLNSHRRAAARISAAAAAPVCNVGYRQLPEVGVEESIADAMTAYRWLLDSGIDPDRIVVAGDSVGGYLSFAVPIRARDAGLPLPAAIVALTPWVHLDPKRKLSSPYAADDPMFPVSFHRLIDRMGIYDNVFSPLEADLTGLPPTFMQLGSTEFNVDEVEEMAARLAAADVPVRLQLWENQVHDFHAFFDVLPEARRAVAEVGDFIRKQIP